MSVFDKVGALAQTAVRRTVEQANALRAQAHLSLAMDHLERQAPASAVQQLEAAHACEHGDHQLAALVRMNLVEVSVQLGRGSVTELAARLCEDSPARNTLALDLAWLSTGEHPTQLRAFFDEHMTSPDFQTLPLLDQIDCQVVYLVRFLRHEQALVSLDQLMIRLPLERWSWTAQYRAASLLGPPAQIDVLVRDFDARFEREGAAMDAEFVERCILDPLERLGATEERSALEERWRSARRAAPSSS